MSAQQPSGSKRKQGRSIRSKMILAFILLVLLPAATVSIVSAVLGYRNGKAQVFNQLESVVWLKKAELRTWVAGLRSDLAFAVSGAEAFSWVRRLLESTTDAQVLDTDQRRAYLGTYAKLRDRFLYVTELPHNPRLRELMLISRQGKVLLSTDVWNERLDFSEQEFFKAGLHYAGVHVERMPNVATKKGVWAVIVVEPLFNTNGEVLALLCGRCDLSHINEIMLQRSGLGESGETFLLGKGAVLLTKSIFRDYAKGEAAFPVYEQFINSGKESGRGMYTGYRGASVIGVYHYLEDLEMLLVAEIEQAEAFRPMSVMLQVNVGVALFSVLLAVLASVFFTRGLSDRLGNLARTAKAIASGDLGCIAPEVGEKEIRSLASAFNAMTGRLKRRFDVENVVAGISRELLGISMDNLEAVLVVVLEKIGRFLGVDRLCVTLLDDDMESRHVFEWCRDGLDSRKTMPYDINFRKLSWLMQVMQGNNVLYVKDSSELPAEASEERSLWQHFKLESLAMAAMQPGEGLRGYLAAENILAKREWSAEELALLTLAAETIGGALDRLFTVQALHKSEERYALAQKVARIGSWEWNIATGKLYCSDTFEAILGYDTESFDGTFRSFLRLVHPEDRKTVLSAIRNSLRHGLDYFVEHRVVLHDDSVRWVSESGAVFRSSDDKPQRVLGILRDITERKQAQEELASLNRQLEHLVEIRTRDLEIKANELEFAYERLLELDKLKSSFLASVSHELRTPLTSIMGFGKLIHKDFFKNFSVKSPQSKARISQRISDNLQIIIQESERLTRLINDVLDLTKIESGKVQWHDRQVKLKECIDKAIASSASLFDAKKDVRLEVRVEPDLPDVFIDPDRITQVLTNLFNNAAKFTEKGVVRCEARVARPGVVQVMVQDTGAGIEEADLDKIFDKFHQASQYDTLQNKPQGTGLGLSISRQIVEKYKGKIWAESELGKGSVFIVELPQDCRKENDAT